MRDMSDICEVQLLYPNDGRQLRRVVTAILKKWLASEVRSVQYVNTYTLVENKVQKIMQKQLTIVTTQENKEKVIEFVKKMSGM